MRGLNLQKLKYILDIGSSSLRLFSTIKLKKNAQIIASEDVLYDGFMDGEFLSPDKLTQELSKLIDSLCSKVKRTIKEIIVGVPGDFSVCVCKRISRKFVELHKFTDQDLAKIFEDNANFGDSLEYVPIHCSTMQCTLDGNEKCVSPVNKKSSSVVLDVSYILVKKSFVKIIQDCLTSLGIQKVDFISTPLAQAIMCQKQENATRPIILVDCGHISTNVFVIKGEGLALLSSFSMGGGHISSDIMQILGLTFKQAELIKRKAVLTVESAKNDNYELCVSGDQIKAPINMTNQIIKSRIELIAKVVKNILSIDTMFNNLELYITGDGVANYKGAKMIFEEVTGHKTKEFKVPFDNSFDKYQTSKTGLASFAEMVI